MRMNDELPFSFHVGLPDMPDAHEMENLPTIEDFKSAVRETLNTFESLWIHLFGDTEPVAVWDGGWPKGHGGPE